MTSDEQDIKVYLRTPSRIATQNAQLIDVGNSASDEDIALLKINSTDSLPFLNISSQAPTTGEYIRIFGFPDNSILTQSAEPSISEGTLTDMAPNQYGTIYYQTTATSAPGDSGGPVLNAKNSVIGITIFKSELISPITQQVESQFTLFLSSNYIIQICKKNHVPINIV